MTDRALADGEANLASPFAGYVLERRLAVGGMSEVFLGRRANTSQLVVIKRLLPDLLEDDAVRETFATESKLYRRIRHPGIVRFLEYGAYAGEPFIALEFVDGVDLSRVLKRARTEARPLAPSACALLGADLLDALDAVHNLTDDGGAPLNVVHRDVTPSNILLSRDGDVKLGDFGIALVSEGQHPRASADLKGKYAYLAPEQVAGEAFDQRADLFSVAVVVAEALLGKPLFFGAGQLAVLLAIRDGRIDALRAARATLPRGMYEILAQALSRDPEDRFPSALEFQRALSGFVGDAPKARAEIAHWVAEACDMESAAKSLEGAMLQNLTRGGSTSGPFAVVSVAVEASVPSPPSVRQAQSQRATQPEDRALCVLRTRDGVARPIHLAKLIEMLATGQIRSEDQVDFGQGFERVDRVSMLTRYLPPTAATTKRVSGPGVPDFAGSIPETSLGEALAWVVRQRESGAFFAEPTKEGEHRSELYFQEGRLVLAVSSEPGTLLGERLVRAGMIDRAQLEIAVLAMHRYNGQLGDTLIGLGFVSPVDVFQALRAQGRERVTALFAWKSGKLSFYRGVEPARLDFKLDLDVPGLVLAGLAASRSDDDVLAAFATRMKETLHAEQPAPPWAKQVTWPSVMHAVLRTFAQGSTIEDALTQLASASASSAQPRAGAAFSRADLLRAIEACAALSVLQSAI